MSTGSKTYMKYRVWLSGQISGTLQDIRLENVYPVLKTSCVSGIKNQPDFKYYTSADFLNCDTTADATAYA